MNEKSEFLKYQDQIIENLETLRMNLENCEEMGMLDIDEITYNHIIDLLDETRAVDTIEGLSDIIQRAKVVETKIDSWYAKQGITNIELTWPQI